MVNQTPWENWNKRNLVFSLTSAGLDEAQVSSFGDVTDLPLHHSFARRPKESCGLAVTLVSLGPISRESPC